MSDHTTLRFGPKNASRRVVFGHGVGGLDKFANTFIKGAVEHWSTDPRLRHVELSARRSHPPGSKEHYFIPSRHAVAPHRLGRTARHRRDT